MSVRPSRVVTRLISVLSVAVALVALPTPVAAQASQTNAFRKAAKTEVKDLKSVGKDALKAVKTAVKDAPKSYGKGDVTAEAAIAQVVAAFAEQRDALEDAAFEAASDLASTGEMLLDGADPPRDFQAGGGGVWDDALFDIEAELDKLDARFVKEMDKFLAAMAKASKKAGDDLVIHYRLPPHGESFWSVASPGAKSGGVGADVDVDPPSQVLIAVRVLETDGDDRITLGIRSPLAEMSINVQTDDEESVDIDELAVDPLSGVGIHSVLMNGFLNTSFARIRVNFDPALGSDAVVTLSAPRIVPSSPEQSAIAKDLKKNGKQRVGFFNKDSARAIKDLTKFLKSHEKALAKGQVPALTALRTGFCDLEVARSEIAFWRRIQHDNATTGPQFELGQIPIVDSLMNGDFKQDACGVHADLVKRFKAAEARRQGQATQKFEKFADKIAKLAAKQGETVAFNMLVGRDRPVGLPMITTAGSNAPDQSLVLPHLSDAFLFVEGSSADGPGGPTAETIAVGPSNTTLQGKVTIFDGDTAVIGGLFTNNNGLAKSNVPILSSIPLLGFLFQGGESQDRPNNLIIMVTPRIVGAEEE